jgi:hypothetical protein
MSGTALLVILSLAVLFGAIAVLAISQVPQIRASPSGARMTSQAIVLCAACDFAQKRIAIADLDGLLSARKCLGEDVCIETRICAAAERLRDRRASAGRDSNPLPLSRVRPPLVDLTSSPFGFQDSDRGGEPRPSGNAAADGSPISRGS